MYRLLALPFCLLLAIPAASQEMHAPAKPSAAFEQLKSLAGQWEGKHGSGAVVHVTYQVVSGGSVLMERLQPQGEAEMITMYSQEGDRILVTHYCSAGNQPTMQTRPLTTPASKLDFTFLRASGMKTPDEGHMVALSVSMPDKDHLTQTWTFQDHGKPLVDTFAYTRKQ